MEATEQQTGQVPPMDTAKTQVQVQLLGSDGEWFTPHQSHAGRAVLRAMREDIKQYSGSYSDGDLRDFRELLRELDATIADRIGN